MTIHEGDGTLAKRMALGLCPKCQTAMLEDSRFECRACGLVIQSRETQDNGVMDPPISTPFIDLESVANMTGALK